MTWVLDILARPAVRFGGIALAIGWAITAWNVSQKRAESRGAAAAQQQTEKQNAKVKEDGRAGARHGGVPVPGSVRDPRYRKD